MRRHELIKGISLSSLGAVIPWENGKATTDELEAKTIPCILIPSEAEGSFMPGTPSCSSMLRQDIRPSKTGIQLGLKLKILDAATGEPIQNAWIKIWHGDKDG